MMRKVLISLLLLSLAVSAYALTYQIKTQIVAVGITATKLPATPLVGREYVILQNVGAATLYVGDSTVTADEAATGGFQLTTGGVWYGEFDKSVDLYGVVISTQNCLVEEGK